MKGKLTTVLLVIIFLAGLSLLLYPAVSDFINSLFHSRLISEYAQEVEKLDEYEYQAQWDQAAAYNQALTERGGQHTLSSEERGVYRSMLNISGRDVMAYVEIPSIGVTLPIAHGTDEKTLANYVGHLEWSSLPVGGESTHCVISGHRGLPSSELFTNIDHLELGDKFYLHVLGRTLEYRVDKTVVVEPYDYTLLGITEGKDYCTLVTCTPYGINSHRLLVRGTRINADIGTGDGEIMVWNEIHKIDLVLIVPAALAVLAAVAFLILLLSGSKKQKGGKYYDKT